MTDEGRSSYLQSRDGQDVPAAKRQHLPETAVLEEQQDDLPENDRTDHEPQQFENLTETAQAGMVMLDNRLSTLTAQVSPCFAFHDTTLKLLCVLLQGHACCSFQLAATLYPRKVMSP